MTRVAVVGAGLAGLTCAQTLRAHGLDVMVIEKSRGVGGRLSTRRTDITQYDHGAQYFTARDARFAEFVRQRLGDGSVVQWEPRLDAVLVQTINEPWYVGSPGMNSIARAQAIGLDVRTELRVHSLAKVDGQWQLNFEQCDPLGGFSAVVIAVPNAQAVPLLDQHVSHWSSQLRKTHMQPCWTLMFSTTAELTHLDAGLPREGAIGWWARNSSKPGRPSTAGRHDWVIQATAEWTEAHLENPKPEIERVLLQAFSSELGIAPVQPLEPPMVHRWLYSRRQAGVPPLAQSLWKSDLGLGVCGDGLTHSRVEQAYLSGLHLAGAMIETFG